MKEEKAVDVKKLLEKHFDLDGKTCAENLKYYINFFNRQRLINHKVNNKCNSEHKYVEECSELII